MANGSDQIRTVQEYVAAFQRCYPNHDIKVSPRRDRQTGITRYAVLIDHELGDRTLTDDELRSATRDFNRGRDA